MSNNKQSSVDFYRSRIIQLTADGVTKRITGEQWDLLERKSYEQAKAMHKEEIIDSYGVGCHFESTRLIGYHDKAEQYYNETFGGNK